MATIDRKLERAFEKLQDVAEELLQYPPREFSELDEMKINFENGWRCKAMDKMWEMTRELLHEHGIGV